jgi:hypothetical protein
MMGMQKWEVYGEICSCSYIVIGLNLTQILTLIDFTFDIMNKFNTALKINFFYLIRPLE